jgi:hypothetical protein
VGGDEDYKQMNSPRHEVVQQLEPAADANDLASSPTERRRLAVDSRIAASSSIRTIRAALPAPVASRVGYSLRAHGGAGDAHGTTYVELALVTAGSSPAIPRYSGRGIRWSRSYREEAGGEHPARAGESHYAAAPNFKDANSNRRR